MDKAKYNPMPTFRPAWKELFWSKMRIGDPNECWEWVGHKCRKGYGVIYLWDRGASRKVQFRGHRVSYFLHYGNDPGEMLVCHKCDNPPCCNPHHLWLGTNSDNMRDAISKGRKTKFLRGEAHPWYGRSCAGELCPNARITEEQARYVISRYSAGGITQVALAREIGISQPHISEIVRGVSWSHLPRPH